MHTAPEVTISNLLQALSILFKVGSLTEPGAQQFNLASEPWRSPCLHLSSNWVTGICCCPWLSLWLGGGIHTQVFTLTQQAPYPLSISPAVSSFLQTPISHLYLFANHLPPHSAIEFTFPPPPGAPLSACNIVLFPDFGYSHKPLYTPLF